MRYLFLMGFFMLIGGLMLFVSNMASYDAKRAEQLPVLSGVVLADSQIGRKALVEGQISRTMLPRYDTLVAYEKQQRKEDSDGDTYWSTEEAVKPMLLIDTSNGRVQVTGSDTSGDYSFHEPPATIYAGNDWRYQGVRVNDTVMALGAVEQGSEGRVLAAEFVHGGTQATYIESQRSAATVFFWIGISMVVAGIVVPTGVFVLSRIRG